MNALRNEPSLISTDERRRIPFSNKIGARHLERQAIVYVRQSSARQVRENIESTQLQYRLVEQARALGWSDQQTVTIDDDLGQSGRSLEGRIGFQRLLAEVSLGHVGIVLGIEMSRLARSCRDWHHLLELCAVFGCLLGDADGTYDPRDHNDRLLLGLKGTMSEAELHILRGRLDAGRKTRRAAASISRRCRSVTSGRIRGLHSSPMNRRGPLFSWSSTNSRSWAVPTRFSITCGRSRFKSGCA